MYSRSVATCVGLAACMPIRLSASNGIAIHMSKALRNETLGFGVLFGVPLSFLQETTSSGTPLFRLISERRFLAASKGLVDTLFWPCLRASATTDADETVSRNRHLKCFQSGTTCADGDTGEGEERKPRIK